MEAEALSSCTGPVAVASKVSSSKARRAKYRREHRKRKSMKKRLTSQAALLKKEVSTVTKERDSFEVKAMNLQKQLAGIKAQIIQPQVTCTKATTAHLHALTGDQSLPAHCRRIAWHEIDKDQCTRIGKGAFGRCYASRMGVLPVCLKVFAVAKYKAFFYTEVKILSLLCHVNLPWLHAVCETSNRSMLVMTFHSYRGGRTSLTVYKGLSKQYAEEITSQSWKQIILGCTSALEYLQSKDILHNDIKSDNVLIEMLPHDYTTARAVLIDFNKACFSHEGITYHLSTEEKKKYMLNHPQVAPEVRSGINKQSFSSDIYSFGRILYKISSIILKIPGVTSMANLCLSKEYKKRPTSAELHTSLSFMLVA